MHNPLAFVDPAAVGARPTTRRLCTESPGRPERPGPLAESRALPLPPHGKPAWDAQRLEDARPCRAETLGGIGGYDGAALWTRSGVGHTMTPPELAGPLGQGSPSFGDSS
jgi:hypothetical protein